MLLSYYCHCRQVGSVYFWILYFLLLFAIIGWLDDSIDEVSSVFDFSAKIDQEKIIEKYRFDSDNL